MLGNETLNRHTRFKPPAVFIRFIVATLLLFMGASVALADTTPPQLSPNFADGQVFENLGEFRVNLYDDVDPLPSVTKAQIASQVEADKSDLTFEFQDACPAGYAELKDGTCEKVQIKSPVYTCPEGYLASGASCTKKVFAESAANRECPSGYIFDDVDPHDLIKDCIKVDTADAEMTCPWDGHLLVGDRCITGTEPVLGPSALSYFASDYKYHKPYLDTPTGRLVGFAPFLSTIDNTYYFPPHGNQRPGGHMVRWNPGMHDLYGGLFQPSDFSVCPAGYIARHGEYETWAWPFKAFQHSGLSLPECVAIGGGGAINPDSTGSHYFDSIYRDNLAVGSSCKYINEDISPGEVDGIYVESPNGSRTCYAVADAQTSNTCPDKVPTQPSGSPYRTVVSTEDVGISSKVGSGCFVLQTTYDQVPLCDGHGVEYDEEVGLCVKTSASARTPEATCPVKDGVSYYQAARTFYVDPLQWWFSPRTVKTYSYYTGNELAVDQCWAMTEADSTLSCADGFSVDKSSGACFTHESAPKTQACDDNFSLENNSCTRKSVAAKTRSNTFRLSLPVLVPGEYTLSLAARDVSGNEGAKTLSFVYRPKGFGLSAGGNSLQLPGIAVPLSHIDGTPAITTESLFDGGNPVVGLQPVYATLLPESELSLVIGGRTVHPGQTVTVDPAYDFDTSGGRLMLDAYPHVEGVTGISDLMLTVGDAGSLVSVFDVNTWKFSPSMSITPDSPIALFGEVDARATPSGCAPVSTAEKAKVFDVFTSPTCHIRWTSVPSGLELSEDRAGLTGTFDAGGQAVFGYDALFVEPDGNEVVVGSYSKTMVVDDFYGSIEFEMPAAEKDMFRGIQKRLLNIRQTKGPGCLATSSEEAAVSSAVGTLMCFIEWTEYPYTMESVDDLGSPGLFGPVTNQGPNIISWAVNLIDSTGKKVVINEQTAIVNGINPVAPAIEILAEKKFSDTLNLAVPGDDYDAYVFVKGAAAPIHLQVTNGSEIIVDEVFEPRLQDTNRISLPLNIPDGSLWQTQTLNVSATYELMPDLFEVAKADFLSVPSTGVIPSMDVSYLEAVNTGATQVNIHMAGVNGDAYEPSTMGLWRVRLVEQTGFQKYNPVTEYFNVSGELTAAMLDFNSFMEPGNTARVYVEAELISPIPEYQRTVLSKRSTSVALLDGQPISGEVKATRMSGSAPVRGIFTVRLDDRSSRRAVENIIWEVSTDDGNTWAIQEDGVRGQQLRMTFETGTYLVRSRIVNRHTGVEFVTAGIEVVAYTRPDIEISGPSTAFIGSNAKLTALLRDDKGNLLAPDSFDIQWSTDNGTTYQPGGLSKTLTRAEKDDVRVMVKVRDKRAPADDYRAFANKRHPLAFRAVKAPNVYVRGTRIAETGAPVTLSAIVREPYLRMGYDMNGHWVLPDGSTRKGDEITFDAPELAEGQDYMFVQYVAWVDGYREQGAESTRVHRMRFWEYKFPEFRIEARQSADVAPVEISAYVRPLGFTGSLEDPQYEWSIPDGIDVTWDRTGRARVMKIDEPGTYILKAYIDDARGSSAIATRTLEIGTPEPLKVDMELRDRTLVRAPYEALVRPIITGGHPRDYYETMTYSVNGEVLEDTSRYARLTLPRGEHEIRLDVTTRMGETAYGTHRVTVARNQLPSCTMDKRLAYGSWRMSAECSDPDGRVRAYEWLIDGRPLSISTNRVSIPQSIFKDKDRVTVELRARDDSGDLSGSIQTEITNSAGN